MNIAPHQINELVAIGLGKDLGGSAGSVPSFEKCCKRPRPHEGQLIMKQRLDRREYLCRWIPGGLYPNGESLPRSSIPPERLHLHLTKIGYKM